MNGINQNIAAMNKLILRTAFLVILTAFSLNNSYGAQSQKYQNLFSNKKETMKSVLQALEEGREYNSMPYWREREYGFSFNLFDISEFDFDFYFDWDSPEFDINEEFFEDMEKKFEIMEKRMQEKLEKMEKRIDSLHQRMSEKYYDLI